MNTQPPSLLNCLALLALVSLAAALAWPAPVVAAPAAPDKPVLVGHAVGAAPALLAAPWYEKAMDKLVGMLNSRKSVVQFCFIAMLIGLWIIWWRR
jgi:hypothetical protein